MKIHDNLTENFWGKTINKVLSEEAKLKILFDDGSSLIIEADSFLVEPDEYVEQSLSVSSETIRVEKGRWSI